MKPINNLRVAVSGASGFVATNVRNLLYQNGATVYGISRKNYSNFPSETRIISPDFNPNFISKKLKKCNALVHLIGKGHQTTKLTFEEVNVGNAKKAVILCKKLKIPKIVYLSGLGVNEKSISAYFISKYKAEQEIIKSGLDYTILRPSYIIGDDDHLTQNLKRQIKRGQIIIPGSGKYQLQPIHVTDVAKVIQLAILSKKFSKKIIDLVGPEKISFSKYVRLFARKYKTKIKNQDLESLYHEALHNAKVSYGVEDLNIMVGNFTGNHKNLQKLCNFEFKSFRDIL